MAFIRLPSAGTGPPSWVRAEHVSIITKIEPEPGKEITLVMVTGCDSKILTANSVQWVRESVEQLLQR